MPAREKAGNKNGPGKVCIPSLCATNTTTTTTIVRVGMKSGALLCMCTEPINAINLMLAARGVGKGNAAKACASSAARRVQEANHYEMFARCLSARLNGAW